MSAQATMEQVRWQDLKVRSEVDLVLEIAQKEGWKDCEVFGHGDMIAEPQESKGWKLIPADLYKDSIPPEAVERLYQLVNAGIRVQGVIIADDERREEPAPAAEVIPASPPAPERPKVSLSFVKPVISWMGQVLPGIAHSAGAILSFSGKALLVFIRIAAVGTLVAFGIYALLHFFWPVLILGSVILMFAGAGTSTNKGTGISYDPKLVILVDGGEGTATWISLYTWYD